MCLIIYSGKNTNKKNEFLEEAIRKAYEFNQDGMGYAVKRSKNNTLFISKGYDDIEYFLDQIKAEKVGLKDELLVHLRIGNKGSKDAVMSHPFVVSEDEDEILQLEGQTDKMIIAHNGTMHKHAVINSLKSDTYFFIKNVMSRESVQDWLYANPKDFVDIMQPHLNSSRLAIMHPTNETILLGKWYEEEGIKFSKDYYVEYLPKPNNVYNWRTGNYASKYGYGYNDSYYDDYDEYGYDQYNVSDNSESLADIIKTFDKEDHGDFDEEGNLIEKINITGLAKGVVCPDLDYSRGSFKNMFGYEYHLYLGLYMPEEDLNPSYIPAITSENVTHFLIFPRETNITYGVDIHSHYALIGASGSFIRVFDFSDDTEINIPTIDFYNMFKVDPKVAYDNIYKHLNVLIKNVNCSKTTLKKLNKAIDTSSFKDKESMNFKNLYNINVDAAIIFRNEIEQELEYRKFPEKLLF